MKLLVVIIFCWTFVAGSSEATLLLQYTFDEASTGTVAALDNGQAPAANGSFNGNSTRVGTTPNGYSLGAMDTNGGVDDDYVTTGSTPAKLNELTSFTLSAWINLQSDLSEFDRVISMHTSGGGGTGFDFFFEDGTLSLAVDANREFADTSFAPETNTWHFLAVTYDGNASSSNLLFYTGQEGEAVTQLGSTLDLNEGPVDSTTADLRVGGTARSGLNRTPDAWFDDVRVYDEVLSSSELDTVRQENLVPEPGSLGLFCITGLLLCTWYRSTNPSRLSFRSRACSL